MTEGTKKKVLVVEDEKPMARALVLKLTNAGFEAKGAYNGEEALGFLDSESFDLILMDLMMPKVDGFMAMEEFKKKGIKTPVIVTSNLSQEDDIKKAKEMGAVDYIVKSDTPIVEIVNKVAALF